VSAIRTCASSSSTGATSSASPSGTGSIEPRRNRALADPRIGEVYLSADEIAARVAELGREIADDYAGREPLLVAALKASVVFLADLSRALTIVHRLDFVSLAGYGNAATGGHQRIRLLKDLDAPIGGRDVLIVEDVVDTGLTLLYLTRILRLRAPRSLVAVTLLDRPYRRLVDELPLRYVGFTVPDEFFVGYGFDLEERYRSLPDLRVVREV
jgi:hypoxanthine phosphoribosyltransferase